MPPETALRLTFVLSRSPAQQAAFMQLLADQQDPTSPRYHQWLTPQQVGTLYGPTQNDLTALTAWLTSQGMAVTDVAPSRVFVTVAAPASTVTNALATSFRYFTVNSERHLSAIAEPSIPSAFSALVTSIAGLTDTPIYPMHHAQAVAAASTLQPAVDQPSQPQPQFTNGTSHYVTPADFAKIFDLTPVYSAGFNGAGQQVAIIGRSRVTNTDISEFEANTGLVTNLPNVVIPTTGVDPGTTGGGDQNEATLDVDRVIGTAPGVQADLVVSGSAGGFNGIYVAAQYEVQTLLDPVMNISFGSCEANASASSVGLWDTLFSQAASEGISVFISADDSGAAGCDTQFATPPAMQVRSINYICASSYATCVGATEFADTANPSQYWSSTNGTGRSSVLSYIPEGVWNEPISTNSFGATIYVVASGGGGASTYISKPSWQTGTGVPADGARDVPDVSFPGAAHDGYYACYAAGNGDCANNRFEFFSGTSAAAPAMAAITALLNQRSGSPQGNLNPTLYRIAASMPTAFHDATPVTSGVACDINTPSMCNNSTPSPTGLTGGLAGYPLTTGYDQATGLGSLDVANFFTAALPSASTQSTTALVASLSPINTSQSVTFTATVGPVTPTADKPTGTVQFFRNGVAFGTPVSLQNGTATSIAETFPTVAAYTVTATYSGDSNFAGSTSTISFSVAAAPTAATTTLLTIGSSSMIAGSINPLTATVTPTATTTKVPGGIVQFYQGSIPIGAALPLTGSTVSTNTAATFAAVGTAPITAVYSGDVNFLGSTSAPQALTVNKISTTMSLNASAPTVTEGGSEVFTALVASSNGIAPTGTVQFSVVNTILGSITLSGNTATLSSPVPNVAGNSIVTASYSGDSKFLPATATTPLTVTVPPSYQISATPTALAISAGATTGNTSTINIAAQGGYAGTVNLTCAVAFPGAAAVTAAPTCALANSAVAVNAASASTTLTVNTAATTTMQSMATPSSMERGASIVLAACLICLLPLRRRPWRALSLALLAVATLGGLSGCSSNKPTTTTIPGTTAGSYTVTVTATNTTSVANPAPITITLMVN